MDITRVLKKNWPTALSPPPPRDEQEADALCGSTAAHFEVSKNGRLSFFEVGEVSAERAALAVALSRREVDEVDYITIDKDQVASIGIEFEKNSGETLLEDVNKAHLDACKITLSRLGDLVVLAAKYSKHSTLSSRAVVEQLCNLLDAGHRPRLHKDLTERVKLTRVYKRIVAERSKSGLPPPL